MVRLGRVVSLQRKAAGVKRLAQKLQKRGAGLTKREPDIKRSCEIRSAVGKHVEGSRKSSGNGIGTGNAKRRSVRFSVGKQGGNFFPIRLDKRQKGNQARNSILSCAGSRGVGAFPGCQNSVSSAAFRGKVIPDPGGGTGGSGIQLFRRKAGDKRFRPIGNGVYRTASGGELYHFSRSGGTKRFQKGSDCSAFFRIDHRIACVRRKDDRGKRFLLPVGGKILRTAFLIGANEQPDAMPERRTEIFQIFHCV